MSYRIFMQVPTEYFSGVLGRHLKYSCCLYGKPDTSLDEAEEAMLGARWLPGWHQLSLFDGMLSSIMHTLCSSCQDAGLKALPCMHSHLLVSKLIIAGSGREERPCILPLPFIRHLHCDTWPV